MADETSGPTEQIMLEEAADEIGRAVQRYYDILKPGDYVTAWVLLNERTSIELEQAKKSVVGVLVKNDQSFVTTRGLMDISLSNERAPRAS